ncbi:MAG: YbcC family protein [Rubripirellula sp.]
MSNNVFTSQDGASAESLQSVQNNKTFAVEPALHGILTDAIDYVTDKMAPVWPLKDYVAVNPYMGFSDTEFLSTREHLRGVSDLELFMPVEYYREQFQAKTITRHDLSAAVDELVADGVTGAEGIDVNQVVRFLQDGRAHGPTADAEFTTAKNQTRSLFTVCEAIDTENGTSYGDLLISEISRHCAAHYDQGQSGWVSTSQQHSLYGSWRAEKSYDMTMEISGVAGFRKFVKQLPENAAEAVELLLSELKIPAELWKNYLLCSALTMPGWSAWAKYQHRQAETSGELCDDLEGLLAIRLAYEVALVTHHDFEVDWPTIAKRHLGEQDGTPDPSENDLWRYALLRASEIAFRSRLVSQVETSQETLSNPASPFSTNEAVTSRKLAQMVFCIDVRSERIRRHIEATSPEVETYGFAGFFGLPIEFVELGACDGQANVPALISPSFKVVEEFDSANGEKDAASTEKVKTYRRTLRSIRYAWKSFQTSAVSMFAFVETTGLLYGWKLVQRSLARSHNRNAGNDGLSAYDSDFLSPSLNGLEEQGIGMQQQVDMAESILRGIGIVDDFARLVVFCGHSSQVENNPLKAGLDCGACCGHSGEPNARFAAKLLNQPELREQLVDRGIVIPDDTQFIGALHNTTTDSIEYFDQHLLPKSHQGDLWELGMSSAFATKATRTERLPLLSTSDASDVERRSADWSEVRPEWGLAGNAAFIVAPRDLTKDISLDGRSFLHSYDYKKDPEFAVLEQIMTAPMVVANWINMQYYASTVDPIHFGSGNKTVHNVVGQFGVFSGNGGDLKTGLPWQSVHDGKHYQHHPLRLLVVLAAPRSAIASILEKHDNVSDLATHGWLQLLAHEDGRFYRFTERKTWEELND